MTPQEAQILYDQHGSHRAAAKAGGVTLGKFQRALYKLKYEGVPDGFVRKGKSTLRDGNGNVTAEWDKTREAGLDEQDEIHVPSPMSIRKVSTMRDAEGRAVVQWVSEKADDVQKEDAWRRFAEELSKDIVPAKPVPIEAGVLNEQLLVGYPIGDHHLGMLAWDRETGNDWDMDIGFRMLENCMTHLVTAAPKAEHALVVFLGDFFHYDSFETVTPAHRNQLDSDTRFPKMIETGARLMRRMIEITLWKHGLVHVIVETGNHDPATSAFMAQCLSMLYENEPRVTVDVSPKHYHYLRHGKVLIGTHHGHGVKMDKLPLIMATDCPADWGKTTHRHWWTGHIHHRKAEEFTGCTVESFRCLPPEDAWHHQQGYRSGRDMKSVVFHSEFGEVARHTANPKMFE